jgi:hypothetical protein
MKKQHWYEVAIALIILVILASVVFHANKTQKQPLTPPESLHAPRDYILIE